MAENGADHSHLLPSPVTISLERKMTVFFSKLDIQKTPINARVVRLGGHLLLAQKVKLILAIMASLWSSWTNVQVSAELIGKTEVVEKLDAVIKEAMKMMEKESLA